MTAEYHEENNNDYGTYRNTAEYRQIMGKMIFFGATVGKRLCEADGMWHIHLNPNRKIVNNLMKNLKLYKVDNVIAAISPDPKKKSTGGYYSYTLKGTGFIKGGAVL